MVTARAFAMRIATITLFIAASGASPQVNFPLNLQFPPVARVGEAYSFQFASTTFRPDNLQYSLAGNPSWLSFTSNNRTLRGIPGAGDIGTTTFTIAAAGEAGAVANMESKLLVVNGNGPTVNGNLSEQLSKAGQLSGPRSVTLLPSKPFEVNFALDTFQATGKILSYHATLADHTPLPAWISFDAQSLHFAGTTPSTTAPLSFDILLIASDESDYAAASASFTLTISNHQLLFKPLMETVKMSKGEHVNLPNLKDKLFLDNAPVRNEDIQSASAQLPSWLSFDDHSFDITGDPPSGLMSQDLSILVQDKYGDEAQYSIHLAFKSELFTAGIGQLNITVGEYFEYKIPRSILTQDNESVSVSFGDLGKWLSFNPATFSIYGTVPKDTSSRNVEGSMTATSGDGTAKDTQTFQLQVLGTGVNPGDTTTDSNPSQPSDSGDPSNDHTASSKGKRTGIIVGSVFSALLAAIILLAFICLLCRRKKQVKGYISPKAPRSPRKTDISRPIPVAEEWRDVDRAHDVDLEKGEDDDDLERTPEHPPQLHLNLATNRKDSHSPASSISEKETKILTQFDESPWGFKDDAGPSHRPHDSMKVPTAIARRESASSSSPLKHKRRTTQVYRDSRRSSGLPLNRRLTGLGHGRHTYSPSRSIVNNSALRRTLSCSSATTRSTSVVSTVPSAFPQPGAARHTTQLTTPAEKRRSIRLVRSSTRDSLLDRRTIDEKRNSYIRKRASAQSPFFGAGSSRMSSSSYKTPPAFVSESSPVFKFALSPLSTNIVKPNDPVEKGTTESELPESLRIRKPSETPSTENGKYPGSLRKPRTERSFIRRHTEAIPKANQDRVQGQDERPETAVYTRTVADRCSSTHHSPRAQELKSSLNSLTGEQIFTDDEMSDSVYSGEEDAIDEAERRDTLKASQFTLPPLNIDVIKAKRNSRRDSKKQSKGDSKRELKRTSERDPTPYSRTLEHGGKENHSSSYNLGLQAAAAGSRAKGKAGAAASPERPKTSAGLPRQAHPTNHGRTASRTTNRSSTHRTSQGRPLSNQDSFKERHSRKSIHSRSQSRQSIGPKKPRERSRTQDCAYPYIHASSALPNPIKEDAATSTAAPSKDLAPEGPSRAQRPQTARGGSTTARQPKRPQFHAFSDFQSYSHSHPTAEPTTPTNTHFSGLGLTLLGGSLGRAEETLRPESVGKDRERTPLSMLASENGATPSPERLRIVEGKARRPVSVEVDEESGNARTGNGPGRKTWGSLKGVLGRGSIWSGKETKAFL